MASTPFKPLAASKLFKPPAPSAQLRPPARTEGHPPCPTPPIPSQGEVRQGRSNSPPPIPLAQGQAQNHAISIETTAATSPGTAKRLFKFMPTLGFRPTKK